MTGFHRTILRASSFTAGLALVLTTTALGQLDSTVFTTLTPRAIGPTGMSGRVGAIDAVERDPNIIYVGAATGGVWKSVDGGLTWKPLTDDLPAASTGAIAIHQPNPDLVWVGTGERNRRNSAGVGTGVYKSLDAGKTWTPMGLDKTGAIDAILIDPRDPDVVYVGALGNTWTDSEDRGIYKTTDGGSSWERILYINERTGVGDLVMDPSNPDHLIAGMWEHRRWPWYFKSGGPGSGLYTSYDGGDTWKQLGMTDGLPDGEIGRIGFAFARSNPNIVYALTEASQSVLLRSEDGGDTWTTVNETRGINGRPFYYGQVEVDPTNENRVWIVESPLRISTDGGRSFENVFDRYVDVHVDHHAFWVSPDARRIVDGNDGGVYISHDGGHTYRHVRNLPLSQLYHVAVDTATPYRVYGGLQDNGSFIAPGVVWHNGGIRYYDWEEVAFGDGMATFPDPNGSRFGFTSTQNGNITRFDRQTGERRSIRPASPDGVTLRYNWNAAMALDPFDDALYLGSQFVQRTTDNGNTWTTISPDLTTNDVAKQMGDTSGGLTYDASGAETHTAIIAIAPSAVQQGVIWVGTDDGNVQVTRDGGTTWTDVTGNIRGVPAATWVPEIRASRYDAGTAFVVFDNHRNGDDAPYLVKTTDFGRSWTSLVTADLDYFLHAIEQDPVNRDLLYVGSEFGLYISLNGGQSWERWQGFPRVPVRGLVVHPREHDLIVGTHGRGAFVVDDIRPLRTLADNAAITDMDLYLFEIPPTIQYLESQVNSPRFVGFTMFEGENRAYGTLLTYHVGSDSDSAKAKIEVLDESGAVVRTFDDPAKQGMNRTAWDLRLDGPRRPAGQGGGGGGGGGFGGGGGPHALPGTYTIRVTVGGDTVSGWATVHADPRFTYTEQDRHRKLDALQRVMRSQEISFETQDRLRNATSGIDAVLERLEGDENQTELHEDGEALKKTLQQALEEFTGEPARQGFWRQSNTVNSALGAAYGQMSSSWDSPSPTEETLIDRGEARLRSGLDVANEALRQAEAYRERVVSAGIELVDPIETIDMSWRPGATSPTESH